MLDWYYLHEIINIFNVSDDGNFNVTTCIKGEINWKIYFASPIVVVFDALVTDTGRAKYWAESVQEKDGVIELRILKYPPYQSKILKKESPSLFSIEYFGTEVTFTLATTKAEQIYRSWLKLLTKK